ncbi:MAG: LacI family DNA-binding transcriptional regulator [Phycisphaerales bacterium JB063]
MAPVTVQQVAQAAGVSRSTANKVLLGEAALFRESTANKVLEAAKALGYKPNMLARGLRHQRTYLIATLLSSVNAALAYELYAGVQQVATDNQCAPVTFSCPTQEHEARSLELCADRQVDALLINTAPQTSTSQNQQRMLELADAGLPMIEIFGRNLKGIPSIVSDYIASGYQSTAKLLASGLKDILFWSPFPFDDQSQSCPKTWFALDMYRGYQQAMREAGQTARIENFEMPMVDGRQLDSRQLLPAAQAMLTRHKGLQAVVSPSALAAISLSHVIAQTPDLVTPGFAQAAMQYGGTPIGARERRVSIRIRSREIGEAAARMAFQQLKGERPDDMAIVPDIQENSPSV